jgi:mono/diheme cytochrome c family protein
LNAIAAYLKDSPAEKVTATAQTTEIDKQAWSRGEALYVDNCTGCHMENGEGLAQAFPPIKGSSAVQAKTPDTVIHVVLAGAKIPATKGKPTGLAMPAFDWKLDDKDVADLVNYIRNAWGNHASLTSADTVSKVRKNVEHGGG